MAGKGIIKKTERNLELIHDFKTGSFSLKELKEKYQITGSRIYAIIKQYEHR